MGVEPKVMEGLLILCGSTHGGEGSDDRKVVICADGLSLHSNQILGVGQLLFGLESRPMAGTDELSRQGHLLQNALLQSAVLVEQPEAIEGVPGEFIISRQHLTLLFIVYIDVIILPPFLPGH